jgi:monoterpene epsilon-lactone hydrolase
MPSRAMDEAIALFLTRRERRGQVPPTLDQLRDAYSPSGRKHPVPDDVSVTEVRAGGVPAHWLTPPGSDPARVLLYLHGGGYRLGSIRSHGELAARLGRASRSRVLLPEYRLAPEHPFPAAVQDVVAAWRWLVQQPIDLSWLAVAGDSAGGGLVLALLTILRDAGEVLPRAAVLLSPWTDLSRSGASMVLRAPDDPILTPGLVTDLAQDYLAGSDPRAPLASPLFASLKGLPPLLIQTGGAEVLRSDSTRLAEAATAVGVEVSLQLSEHLLSEHARHPRSSTRNAGDRSVPLPQTSHSRSPTADRRRWPGRSSAQPSGSV